MSFICCCLPYRRSASRTRVIAGREEGGVAFPSSEVSKRILDGASRELVERKDGASLSSRVAGIAPSPSEQSVGNADSPSPVVQADPSPVVQADPSPAEQEEERRALGVGELIIELERARKMFYPEGSDAGSGAPPPPTAGRRPPVHNYEFPNSEEGKRESHRAIGRGVVATVAIRLASAVIP
ncbi:MAG: hypothetical protein OXF02_03580 [Simkaniaceae bacterium]|nr:hypothetical protein [Simkaniaceae bacterium]